MKTKYKVIIGVIVFVIIVCGGLINFNTKAKSVNSDLADNAKATYNLKNTIDISPAIIIGKNIVITKDEFILEEKAYKLNNDKNPKKSAIQHLLERKVLLHKALEMGYSVTEKEVDKEIALVRKAVKASENYSDYVNFMKDYNGGENAYWMDIRKTMKKSMIINKYLDREREKYEKANDDSASFSSDSKTDNLLNGWNAYKDKIVKNLINKEHIQVIDKDYDE